MKKTKYIIISIFSVIVLNIMLSFNTQSMKGMSEDESWKAIYRKDTFDPKQTWEGMLYWRGKEKIAATLIEFRVNGVTWTLIDENLDIEDEFTFITFGEKPENGDILELRINWKEGNSEKTEYIRLK